MAKKIVNLLLCGGSGARLWPVSRETYPKQFCKFTGKYTLFQETVLRNNGLCDEIFIVTNVQHYCLAKAQIEELGLKKVRFLLEPIGRNTAPAITLSCLALNVDDVVVVTPTDHYIADQEQYGNAINESKILAEKDYLVTFGIKPSFPETGFGYIEVEGENVLSFKEKPDMKTAEKYFESGKYYWNSGMFVFRVGTYLDEIKKYSEEIFSTSKEAFKKKESIKGTIKIHEYNMKKIPADSIDYAVMEKSNKIKMLTLNTNWSDLGCFESIERILTNIVSDDITEEKEILLDSKDNFVISDNKAVVLIDVNDLVIICTDDAVLISKRGSSQKIKELIPELEKKFPNITKTRLLI